MNSFLPAGVLPESECKGRDFYGYHQTSAHFFYAKKHFFRPKRGDTLLYHARTREGRKTRKTERGTRERGAQSAAAPCGKHASTCRRVLEYFPQSTATASARSRNEMRSASRGIAESGNGKTALQEKSASSESSVEFELKYVYRSKGLFFRISCIRLFQETFETSASPFYPHSPLPQ